MSFDYQNCVFKYNTKSNFYKSKTLLKDIFKNYINGKILFVKQNRY